MPLLGRPPDGLRRGIIFAFRFVDVRAVLDSAPRYLRSTLVQRGGAGVAGGGEEGCGQARQECPSTELGANGIMGAHG